MGSVLCRKRRDKGQVSSSAILLARTGRRPPLPQVDGRMVALTGPEMRGSVSLWAGSLSVLVASAGVTREVGLEVLGGPRTSTGCRAFSFSGTGVDVTPMMPLASTSGMAIRRCDCKANGRFGFKLILESGT